MHLCRGLNQGGIVLYNFLTFTLSNSPLSKIDKGSCSRFSAKNTNDDGCVLPRNTFTKFPISSNITRADSFSSIPGLHKVIRPSTVVFKIPFIIVSAINREIGRCFTHVIKKFYKAITPGFAYPNSSPSIIMIAMIRGVTTPVFHTKPNGECSGVRHAMGNFMTYFTTFRRSFSKLCSENNTFCSTITHYMPAVISVFSWSPTCGDPSSKSLSRMIIFTFHSLRSYHRPHLNMVKT